VDGEFAGKRKLLVVVLQNMDPSHAVVTECTVKSIVHFQQCNGNESVKLGGDNGFARFYYIIEQP
jgi:hypothetical protein